MSILDKFSKAPSALSKITSVNFLKDTFAKGFTKNMTTTQQTGAQSKFSLLNKIKKYKG